VAGATLLFASFGAALVVSDFLYRRFEKPITEWGHRQARAATQPAPALPAAPGSAASA
jgi:peptidoglycan/LPS O-acetylase OafA/YrhL